MESEQKNSAAGYLENVLKSGFSEEKFCETAAQRQLPYGPGHYFRLICLMPEIKSNKREMWDTATMEFVIENVLSELYEETDIAVDTVFTRNRASTGLLHSQGKKHSRRTAGGTVKFCSNLLRG